jgi:hypothetical protein
MHFRDVFRRRTRYFKSNFQVLSFLVRHNLKPKRICQALLPKDEKGIDFVFEDGKRIKITDEIFCSNYGFEVKTILEEELILAEIFEIRPKSKDDDDNFCYFLAGLTL